MHWIINLSLGLRYLIIALAAVLVFFGVVQLREVPIDVYPEIDPPYVEVQTEALGLAANEVEALITTPLEADLLNGVAWLDRIYSQSVAGLSSIIMVFEPGTDPIDARQVVQERLTQTFALPNVSKPPTMLQPLSTSSRVMLVGLSSTDISLIDMSLLAHWNIRPRLQGVSGVANVAIWGMRDSQLQVLVDPARLHEADVTLQEIIETAGEALWVSPLSYLESSSPGTTGWIDTPNQRISILHKLPISTPNDLANVVVEDTNGELSLGDVATIVEDHQQLIGDASVQDGTGLILVVEKFADANTLEVTKGVEAALEAMKPGLTGINIDTTVFRSANYIEMALSNLSSSLAIGTVLLIVVLVALFWGVRTALIAIVVIPVSLLAATFVLATRGVTFNTMILAGLAMALATIIDDAVTTVENVTRRLRQHQEAGSDGTTVSVIRGGVFEVRGPIFFGIFIMLLAILPVFFLQGVTGAFFQPLAVSYVLAILASTLVALLLTPALCLVLLANPPLGRQEPPLVRSLQSLHGGILSQIVRSPNLALIGAGVIAVIGLIALLPLRQAWLPEFKQTDLRIQWDAVPGTSQQAMNRITTQAADELRLMPGVRNVGYHLGRAITGDQVVTMSSGELWVSLDPAANYTETVAAIRSVINGYPGLLHEVQTYQPNRVGEILTTSDWDVVVRVYGNDFQLLHEKAQEVSDAISGVGGLVDVRANFPIEEPQVEVEVDLAKAERYWLKPGDVRRTAATLISGLRVGNLYEEQKVFDVVVWGIPEIRSDLLDIGNILIDSPTGDQVRLGDLADIRIVANPVSIQRDSVSRYIDVTANISGRDANSVVADIKSSIQGIEFPLEFHAEVFNESGQRQADLQRLGAFAIAAVFGIFLILQAAFDSWLLGVVAILTLPVALAGGAVTALLGGGVLSYGSLFGFMVVFGLAVRNGLVMTRHFQHLARYEGETFGPELVLRGARERLASMVMVALAMAGAVLPFILTGDIAGNEILRPMAIVILGGLVTTLLLDLFILPALYLRFATATQTEDWDLILGEQPAMAGTD
jgi:CzcA family heavy metal efflux pump